MPRKKKTEVEIEKQSVEVIENVENEADTDVEAVKNEDAEYENTAVSNEPTVLQENEPIEKKPVKRRKRKTEAEKEDAEELRDTLALLRGGKQKMTIYSRMLERIETNENTVEALNYIAQNPAQAQQAGWSNLTNSLNQTSKQIKKIVGSGYSLSMMKPNDNQTALYTAKDGEQTYSIVNQ